jgi:K+-sensing histidine kinase KdpD
MSQQHQGYVVLHRRVPSALATLQTQTLLRKTEAFLYPPTTPGVKSQVFASTAKLFVKLIRKSYSFIKKIISDFWVVYVCYPGSVLSQEQKKTLEEFELMTRNFGGYFTVIEDESLSDAIAGFIEKNNVTYAIIGQSNSFSLESTLKGSLINRIVKKTGRADIVVVADFKSN